MGAAETDLTARSQALREAMGAGRPAHGILDAWPVLNDGVLRVFAEIRYMFVINGVRLAVLVLFMGWFLSEQVEEVARMTTLLRIADRAGANLFHLEDFVAREMSEAATDPTAPKAAGGGI